MGYHGSFYKAYHRYNDSFVSDSSHLVFMSVDISEEVADDKFKLYDENTIRHAIESSVHYAFDKNPHAFKRKLRIISDISRTTPSAFRQWKYSNQLGIQIFEMFVKQYNS